MKNNLIGTIPALIGVLLLVINIDYIYFSFTFFLLSNLFYLEFLEDKPKHIFLFYTNLFFLIIDIAGLLKFYIESFK